MYVTISVGKLLACAAWAGSAQRLTIVALSLLAKPGEEGLAAGASVCCAAPRLSRVSRTSRAVVDVSMFIAAQTRGIPPASNSGGTAQIGPSRTSVAIVESRMCVFVSVEGGCGSGAGVRVRVWKDRVVDQSVGNLRCFEREDEEASDCLLKGLANGNTTGGQHLAPSRNRPPQRPIPMRSFPF
jgi:hypothetical protein